MKQDGFRANWKLNTIVCLALIVVGIFASVHPPAFASSGPPYTAKGFDILSTAWGTPSARGEAGAGDTDVPLTVTFEYVYSPGEAISTTATLGTSGTGFSSPSGGPNSTEYYSNTLLAGSIFELTFYLDLNSSLKVGERYTLPLTLLWSAILSNSTNAPETFLIQSTTVSILVEGDSHLVFQTSQTNLVPGEVNDLNFTITNDGTGFASNVLTSLSATQAGIQSTIPDIQNLTAGASETFPLQIYVPESSAGSVIPLLVSATFQDPYGNNGSTSQAIDLHSSVLNEPRLVFSAQRVTLLPGEVNNITVILTNMGSENASNIITTTTSSVQGTSILQDFPTISTLGQSSTSTATVSVYIPNSAAGQALTLTFSATYIDPSGSSGTASQEAGFTIASSSSVPESTFSVTTLSNSVITGEDSNVSFLVKNIGNTTIYSPDYSIDATQPLVIAANSSFSSTGTSLAPGQSQTFTCELTASPGTSSGIYTATLQVSFTDKYGTKYNQSYSEAISLSGSIELVVQNEAYSQNATGITVTGNLLDEGSSAAYYSSISGYLNNTKTPEPSNYIGEIDPNTPVPFTVTIPYTAQDNSATGNITLLLQYRNSLGQNLNSTSNGATVLKSASQIFAPDSPNSSNSGSSAPNIVELGLIAIVVIVVVAVGVVAAVRRRSSRAKRSGRAAKQLQSGSVA